MHSISHSWRWVALLACTLIMLAACGGDLDAQKSVFPPEELAKIMADPYGPPSYAVKVRGGALLKALPPEAFNQPFERTITIQNTGKLTDTYIIITRSQLGWTTFAAVPAYVTLAPRQSNSFSVQVTLPKPLDAVLEEAIVVTAQSIRESSSSDSAVLIIRDPQPMRPIRPVLECVTDNGDGTYTAYFGYNNENPFTVQVPISNDNTFTPPPQNRGQPTSFAPGYQRGIFSVIFKGNKVVWTITNSVDQNDTATASRTSVKCGLATGVLSITIV